MFDSAKIKSQKTGDAAAVVFLFLGMVIYNLRPVQALDLGWHLASGRFMVEARQIPHVDVFSFTCHGQRWVNSYWLQDVLLFLWYRLAHIPGMVFLKALFVAFLVLEIVRHALRDHSFSARSWAAFWIFIGAAPRGYGWSEQASLVTLLFLAVLFAFLEKNQYKVSVFNPSFVFLFFALWSNMHRGVLLGLATLVCCLIPELFTRKPTRWRSLGLVALGAASTLATPWGLHLYHMMADDMRLSPIYIAGWAATPWHHLEIFWLTWGLLILFWIWRFVGGRVNIKDSPSFLISVFLTWNSFRYVSQVPYFMIWAVPLLAKEFFRQKMADDANPAWSLAHVLIFIPILFLWMGNRPALGINSGIFPVAGCDFIQSQNLSGRFFQEYSFGGYWLWRFGLTKPVFIDGRYPAVDGYAALYKEMQAAMQGPPAKWQALLDHYAVEGAIIRYPQGSPLPFPFAMYFPRRLWALVYWDDVDLIFLRRNANQSCISKYEYRDVQPDASPKALANYWAHATTAEKSAWHAQLLKNRQAHPESQRTLYLLQLLEG